MSKLKARIKAEKRKALKLKNEELIKVKIMQAKRDFDVRSQMQIKRNAIEAAKRKDLSDRKKYTASDESKEIKNKIQLIVKEIIDLIGDNSRLACDFILEEVDAAANGNKEAKKFAKNSGLLEQNYKGALLREVPEVENGPQLILIKHSSELMSKKGIEYCVRIRLEVIDRIMQIYEVGKYDKSTSYLSLEKSTEEAFVEYFNYCKNPKSYGTVRLMQKLLSLVSYISSPSTNLQTHINLMKVVSLCGINAKSCHIPLRVLKSGVRTELSVFTFVKKSHWLSAVGSFYSYGLTKSEFSACLDLPRIVGSLDAEYVINVAPAIYNTFNLIYSELPSCNYTESIRKQMWDTSLVSGEVIGNLIGHEVYRNWVFNQVGEQANRGKN